MSDTIISDKKRKYADLEDQKSYLELYPNVSQINDLMWIWETNAFSGGKSNYKEMIKLNKIKSLIKNNKGFIEEPHVIWATNGIMICWPNKEINNQHQPVPVEEDLYADMPELVDCDPYCEH